MQLPELNLAQFIGIIAFAIVLFAFSRKRDDHFIFGQIISSIFWVFHYGMLGKLAAAAVTAIHIIRYGSAMLARKHTRKRYMIAVGVSLLYLLSALHFAEVPMDWMPIIASITGSFTVALLSGIPMRAVFLLVSCFWLLFNLYSHSIGGVLTDISVLTINSYTIWRMHRDHRSASQET